MFSLVFKIGKKSSPLAVKLSTVFKSLHLPRWVAQAGETLASQFTSSISALTCPRSPLRLCQIFAFQQVHLRDSLSPLPPRLISETPGTTLSGGPSYHAATACPHKDGRSRKAQQTFSLSLLYPGSQAPLASLYPRPPEDPASSVYFYTPIHISTWGLDSQGPPMGRGQMNLGWNTDSATIPWGALTTPLSLCSLPLK